jgi:hypothetical protein
MVGRDHDCHLLRFLFLVRHRVHLDRLADAQLGPERLLEQLGIVLDHRVGRLQDAGGGAVVLLQLDQAQVREVHLQQGQVFHGGAAPAVDGLVVVAHGGEHGLLAQARHHQLHQLVLARVGVLVFVDHQVAQAALPLVAHRVVVAEQFHRQADQVVEVDRLVGRQGGDIAAVDARRLRLVLGLGLLERLLGGDQAVFPQRDVVLDAADQVLVGGDGQVLHQRIAVIAVHD